MSVKEKLLILFFSFLILIILFLICREIICWFWKINLHIKNQESIIDLLKEIRDSQVRDSNNRIKQNLLEQDHDKYKGIL